MVTISTIWLLSDGKAGGEIQCRGVAGRFVEKVAGGCEVSIHVRRIAPRAPWRWFSQFGILDPRERIGAPSGPLAGPLPDMVIASGRKTLPHLRALTNARGNRPFTVYLKDPRTSSDIADFIWAPQHDGITGSNVMKTLTSPHCITPTALSAARHNVRPEISGLPAPRIAVLVGGDSRHHTFCPDDIDRFLGNLRNVVATGAGLMISTSRRTPRKLAAALEIHKSDANVFLWDGLGENPYLSMLANADAVIVTADSVNMVGEAAVIGKPVHVFHPGGGHYRITKFLDGLAAVGITTNFDGRIELGEREPLDSTPLIAEAILKQFEVWQARRSSQS